MAVTRQGNYKTDSIRKQIPKQNGKEIFNCELEFIAVVWGLEKFRFYLYGEKVHLYTDPQALEPLIKRNRCIKQYSARLTRWLDRLTHFEISIQYIAGSNLKFTDCLCRNPLGESRRKQITMKNT